jgi:signal transduction histidine kinase
MCKERGPRRHTAPKTTAGHNPAARKTPCEVRVKAQAGVSVLEHETALRQSREELRALTASLLETLDSERRYVARELHDDVTQNIADLVFSLDAVMEGLPPELEDERKLVVTVRDRILNLANEMRRIAHRLHPSLIEHLGLAGAVRAFVREFGHREKIPIRLVLRGIPERIPLGVAGSIYCIVQEALRNVAKHAGKAGSVITLSGSRNELNICIEDTGIGFDPSTPVVGGLGLISMRERVRLMNGDFHLASKPGSGVRINVRVPLGQKPAR